MKARAVGLSSRLCFHCARPERLFHPLGDLAQIRVAGLAAGTPEGAQGSSPLKFGVNGARVSSDAARFYQSAMNDVASMLVLASQAAFDVMCAVEDGTIEAPEQIFYGFGECQDELNKLIQNRATLKASVDTGGRVADRLAKLVGELKGHKRD